MAKKVRIFMGLQDSVMLKKVCDTSVHKSIKTEEGVAEQLFGYTLFVMGLNGSVVVLQLLEVLEHHRNIIYDVRG